MNGKIGITFFGILYSIAVSAGPLSLDCQTSPLEENLKEIAKVTKTFDCQPDLNKITLLCLAVSRGQEIKPTPPANFRFLYQKRLWEVACAKPGVDSLSQANEKITYMWNEYRHLFACDVSGFSVPNGNILKLSIDSTFTRFIKDLLRNYHLDVNFKDPADGKTILEFLDSEIQTAKELNATDKLSELEEIKNLILNKSKNT